MELTLFLFLCPFYSNDDALNQRAEAADGVSAAPQEPINDLLKPHGRVWEVKENLNIDPAIDNKYKTPSYIAWAPHEQLTLLDDRGPMHYFFHFFPLQVVQSMLEQTNKEMVNRGYVGNVCLEGPSHKKQRVEGSSSARVVSEYISDEESSSSSEVESVDEEEESSDEGEDEVPR